MSYYEISVAIYDLYILRTKRDLDREIAKFYNYLSNN